MVKSRSVGWDGTPISKVLSEKKGGFTLSQGKADFLLKGFQKPVPAGLLQDKRKVGKIILSSSAHIFVCTHIDMRPAWAGDAVQIHFGDG